MAFKVLGTQEITPTALSLQYFKHLWVCSFEMTFRVQQAVPVEYPAFRLQLVFDRDNSNQTSLAILLPSLVSNGFWLFQNIKPIIYLPDIVDIFKNVLHTVHSKLILRILASLEENVGL